MRILLPTLLILFSFSALSQVNSQEIKKYKLDPTHTNIVWMGDHLGFSKSLGQFFDFEGYITLNFEHPAKSSAEVTIQTASISTGLPKFDDHLKNEDFFDVEKHPEAKFVSNNVEVTGENTAKLHGDLTMLGITKPLTLDVTLNKTGSNPYSGNETAGFSVRGTIIRSQYGMDYGLPYISNEVPLLIEAEATRRF